MSPRTALRSDSPKFINALSSSVNWIISPQGGIIFREGFKNMVESTNTAADSRVFRWHRGGSVSDYIVHVTSVDVRFYLDGVEQTDIISHDFLQSELEDLWFTNSENVAILLHQDHPPLYMEIALDGTITGEELPSNVIPLADYKDSSSPTAKTQGDADYSLDFINGTDTTWNPSRNWTLKYDNVWAVGGQGKIKEFEFSAVAATLATRVAEALEFIPALRGADTTIAVVPGGAGTDFSLIEVTITGAQGGKLLELFSANESADRYVEVTPSVDENDVLEPAWSFPTYVLHNAVYYQCIAPHEPDATNEPGVGGSYATFWTSVGATKPGTFDYQYPTGNNWTLTAVQYSPGDRGFPTVGVIHKQRMILMANTAAPTGVFGSRIGEYKDFTLGPQDDDPFFFAIDTSDAPRIKWATAQRRLLLGTSSGDYTIQAQVTLSPSDVDPEKQNSARSHGTAPVTINTDVFYIEQGKEKIRSTGYSDDLNSQTSKDISLIAEHLLNSRVKRLALMKSPEVLIFGLREDGSLVVIAYSHEMGTGSWFEFESQGTIIDVCGAYSTINDEDELWCIITYDGGVTRFLQKMPYPKRVFTVAEEPTDPHLVDQDMVLMDGWLTGSLTVGENNIITGLDQYEGLLVAAMVNDAYAGEYTVNDGAIILDEPPDDDVPNYSGTWAVGFRYEGLAKTFEEIRGNPKGTAHGTKRRWNWLRLKTLNSALPIINGQLPPDRTPATVMGVAEIIRDGLDDVGINVLGWEDGSITILQDRPYPTQVLGFYGEFGIGNA